MHTQAAGGNGIHKTRTPGSAVTATQQRPMHLLTQNWASQCTNYRAAMPAEVIHAVPVHNRSAGASVISRVQVG